MIGHKLSNKTKSATVAEPKKFSQLNMPLVGKLENCRTSVLIWPVTFIWIGPFVFGASYVVAVPLWKNCIVNGENQASRHYPFYIGVQELIISALLLS
jgi:hypothetical protein